MKKLFVLIFMILTIISNGQSVCTSTEVPTKIYYPNSITTNSTGTFCEYLCGPNTVVYDTLIYACTIFVSSNCTLTLKPLFTCPFPNSVYLKSNSTLNFIAGTGGDSYVVIMEPGAVINNAGGALVSTYTCSAISFPTVNCISAGVNEKTSNNEMLNIYPNPANELLNIDFRTLNDKNAKLEIINNLGQVVYQSTITNRQSQINIEWLNKGIYSIQIESNTKVSRSKLLKQ